MHNPDSVLEIETQKVLWDLKIQTDHLISARRPYLVVIVKKKKRKQKRENPPNSGQSENQRKRKERQELGPYQGAKIPMKHGGDGDTNGNRCTWDNSKSLGKGSGRIKNRRTNRDHLNYSIANIGQNTEKSPGDLRSHSDSRKNLPIKKLL